MNSKVILISIDGMRPDGLLGCGNPYVDELKKIGSYTFDAKTVFPSVTLPCHMSLFHSVTPERHGTTTNTYMPQVRPINGLFEQLANSEKVSAIFYGWEPLRDVARPESLKWAQYINAYSFEHTDAMLTDRALEYIDMAKPDFVFLYMVETDEKGGHDRAHGSDMDEDMTIPMFFCGEDFVAGKELTGVSILDITPTIAEVMGVSKAKEWEGKSLLGDK